MAAFEETVDVYLADAKQGVRNFAGELRLLEYRGRDHISSANSVVGQEKSESRFHFDAGGSPK